VAPGATVGLSAETIDAFGHRWRSTTTATADAKGALELADPDALIWSMSFDSPDATPDLFIPPAEPAMTVVVAEAAGKRSHATLVRSASAPDIEIQEVRAPGVVGRLFLPPGTASVPGTVLFPGSEGGLDSQTSNAELLASHGCAALVAATFAGDGLAVAGLPSRLERVPLERFADAIRWLASHDRVDASRVSAMAISRGSEGLLATASRTDDLPLRSIVAVSPSSATWVGLGENGSLVGIPAWTLDGDDLPAVQTDDQAVLSDIARQAIRRRGRRTRFGPALLHLSHGFAPKLNDPEVTGAAAIESERIQEPLLLVAGGADGVWPSGEMAKRLLERRRQAQVAAAADDQLLTYPDAGHLIRLGCWPTTVTHAGSIALGGTPAGLAAAQADLTPRIISLVTS
jgi:dienelactone hydrolase